MDAFAKGILGVRLAFGIGALLTLGACSKFDRLSGSDRVARVTVGTGDPADGFPDGRFQALGTPQTGGVVVWAVKNDGTTRAAATLPTDTATYTMNLTFGSWTFYASGWDGTGNFQGNDRCGRTTIDVESTTTAVTIPIGLSGCSDTFYGSSAFNPVKVISCNNVSSVTNGMSTCTSALAGDLLSYKLRFYGYAPTHVRPTNYTTYLDSACSDIGTSADSVSLPLPDGTTSSSPIAFTIIGYTAAACGGSAVEFTYINGAHDTPDGQTAKFFPGMSVLSGKNVFYLQHGP